MFAWLRKVSFPSFLRCLAAAPFPPSFPAYCDTNSLALPLSQSVLYEDSSAEARTILNHSEIPVQSKVNPELLPSDNWPLGRLLFYLAYGIEGTEMEGSVLLYSSARFWDGIRQKKVWNFSSRACFLPKWDSGRASRNWGP